MNDLEAFILIGGRSSRMGSDKAAVLFEGVPMAERVAATIHEAFPNIHLRLVASGQEQLLSLANIDFADGFVFDIVSARGPVGGVYSALGNSEKEWALILACDMPMISASLLRYIEDSINEDLDAVVPLQPDGQPQPLAAFYRVKTVRDVIEELLERPRPTPSMRDVLDGLRVRFVPTDDVADSDVLFTNVNSQSDIR